MSDIIVVSCRVNSPIEHIWNSWTKSNHITKWYFASEEWHCPEASIDFKEDGVFSFRMEAKDGSMGFDYSGIFTKIIQNQLIEYQLDDDRNISITFESKDDFVLVTESFEPDTQNDPEFQKMGWQAILNNFKNYVEKQVNE